MGEEQPSPEIIAAVEGAVAWLAAVQISGLRVETSTGADGQRERLAVADPAAPPIWARFYELGTNRPHLPWARPGFSLRPQRDRA